MTVFMRVELARFAMIAFLLPGCGKPGSTAEDKNSSNQRAVSDSSGSEMDLTWLGRRQSENVIDLRPQPCANPKNCVAMFQTGQCAARPVVTGSSGLYNSGLCEVDSNGKLTTFCHIEERCCNNSAEGPGKAGCDFKPKTEKFPCDPKALNLGCSAGKVISENKFLCHRSVQTGTCSWSWNNNSWQGVCDEVGQVMTKEDGCLGLIHSPTR